MNQRLITPVTRNDGDDDYDQGFALMRPMPEWHQHITAIRQAFDAACIRLPDLPQPTFPTLEYTPRRNTQVIGLNAFTIDEYFRNTSMVEALNRFWQAVDAQSSWVAKPFMRVEIPDGHELTEFLNEVDNEWLPTICIEADRPDINDQRLTMHLRFGDWRTYPLTFDKFLTGATTFDSPLTKPLTLTGGE